MVGFRVVFRPLVRWILCPRPPKVAELPLAVAAAQPVKVHVDGFGGLGNGLLLINPYAVSLSVWIGVHGCGWPSSLSLKLLEYRQGKRLSYFSKVIIIGVVDGTTPSKFEKEVDSIYQVLNEYCGTLAIGIPDFSAVLYDRNNVLIPIN